MLTQYVVFFVDFYFLKCYTFNKRCFYCYVNRMGLQEALHEVI